MGTLASGLPGTTSPHLSSASLCSCNQRDSIPPTKRYHLLPLKLGLPRTQDWGFLLGYEMPRKRHQAGGYGEGHNVPNRVGSAPSLIPWPSPPYCLGAPNSHVPGAAPATFLPVQTPFWTMRPSAGESRCLSSFASSWGSLFAYSWPSWQGRCKVPELGTEVRPDSAVQRKQLLERLSNVSDVHGLCWGRGACAVSLH